MRIAIVGILGQMGQTLCQLLEKTSEMTLVGGVDILSNKKNSFPIDTTNKDKINKIIDDPQKIAGEVDLFIDFSSSAALTKLLPCALSYKKPLAIGTTALSKEDFSLLKEAAKKIPILYSSNFSMGIFLCRDFIKNGMNLFPDSCCDIIETHHTKKKDRPSGTALKLADEAEKCGFSPSIHSLRAGKITGEHTIIFTTDEEQIKITHRAFSRTTFAKGALQGVQVLQGKKAGFYTFFDLLKGKVNRKNYKKR